MKKLIYCVALFASSICITEAQNAQTGSPQSWSFTITPTTTRATIDSLTADWKTHGIDFRLYSPRFNANGVLESFEGSVAYFAGKSHAGAKFNNQTHKTITILVTNKPSVTVSAK